MYLISPIYEQLLRKRSRTWVIKVEIAGTEYGSSQIVDFEIENSLVSGDDFEIGTAIASKLTLTMRMPDQLPVNAKVIPYLGLSLSSMRWIDAEFPWEDADFPWVGGTTEWLPMGEFYIDNREKTGPVWVYTCYDKLMFSNTPYISSLSFPATQQEVWDEICSRLGYTYDASVVIDPALKFEVAPTGYTMRQMLGYIAGANGASVYVGKDGVVRFKRFSATEAAVYDLGPSDYIRATQTNPIRTITRIVATYDTEDDLSYEAGNGDDNHTLYLTNPFVTQAAVDKIFEKMNGFAYMPISMSARGYPQLEAGDRISFIRNESMAWKDAATPWEDMDIPWDGLVGYASIILHTVFRFKGGLSMTIEAPSASEQQSEFPVEGTLTSAVNNLNKTTVKQGRHYYGVTITKDDGLVVERDDHASKVVLNSDEMTFWADGEKAIWFDVPSRQFKFSGTLEASDFIGGTIAIGGDDFDSSPFRVTEEGKMYATGAEIQSSESYPKSIFSPDDDFVGVYLDEYRSVGFINLVESPSVPALRFFDEETTGVAFMYYDSSDPQLVILTGGGDEGADIRISATSADVIITGRVVRIKGIDVYSMLQDLDDRVTSLENGG